MSQFSMRVNGLLGASFPWSFGFWGASTDSEASVSSTFNTAVTALFNTATNGLENFMSADVTATNTIVSTLNATLHQTTKTTASLSITGTDANASLPWDTAEVVTLRTPFATKAGHGRIFLPPFAEDQIVAHVIKAATITSMVTVFEAFFNTMTTDLGMVFFIFNKKPLKNGTPAYTISDITAFDVPNKPAVQRRRVSKLVPARSVGTI